MLKIDNALLDTIGLSSLPADEKKAILQHMYETLEIRVGARLAEKMTDQQLDEFEKYFEAKDDQGAFNFLQTNFPNYKDIVHEEFNKLKDEVAASAPHILSEAQSNASPQTNSPNVAPAQENSNASNNSQPYQPMPADYQPPAPDYPTQQPPAGPQQ
jgi:hypothetical protein